MKPILVQRRFRLGVVLFVVVICSVVINYHLPVWIYIPTFLVGAFLLQPNAFKPTVNASLSDCEKEVLEKATRITDLVISQDKQKYSNIERATLIQHNYLILLATKEGRK